MLLISLYFDLGYLIYAQIAVLILEGITGWRVPVLAQKLRGNPIAEETAQECRINIESERAWSLMAGVMLLITYGLFFDMLWIFPWFMAFAFFGAGLSGVCPMLLILQWAGFKK